jgi:membrane-associated phospholipid phosphatase
MMIQPEYSCPTGKELRFRPTGHRAFVFLLLLFSFSISLPAQNADIRWLRSINHPVNTGLDKSMRVVSGSVVPVAIGTVAGSYIYNYVKKPEGQYGIAPFLIGGSMLAASGISLGLKYAVNRPRPFVTYPDIQQRDPHVGPYSFPSAHTANAFALAASASFVCPKWYVIAPAFLYAGTVAYSRMRLGVHFPTDVLAGAIIGTSCAWLSFTVNRRISAGMSGK